MEKKPILTLEQVKEIEKTYPTPFHIYDEKGIRENARALKKAFSWNKGYRRIFCCKGNPEPVYSENSAGGRMRCGLFFPDRTDAVRSPWLYEE